VSVPANSRPGCRGSLRIVLATASPAIPVLILRPRLAAVVRAVEMRLDLVEAQRVGRGVRDQRVEVSRLDVEDARPRLDRRRVTLVHVMPPSRVTWIWPSSLPPTGWRASGTRAERGDAAHGAGFTVLAYLPRWQALPRRARQIGRDPRPGVAVVDAPSTPRWTRSTSCSPSTGEKCSGMVRTFLFIAPPPGSVAVVSGPDQRRL
jgi:hypothetical protein